MSMPYCPEAINALRHAAARNIRAAEIQASLGWDGQMLERVCKKHQIDIIGAIPATPKIEPPKPQISARDPVRAFAGRMSGMAGTILLALTRAPLGAVVKTIDMGIISKNPGRAIAIANKLLEREGLPWVIESFRPKSHDGGYRLVKTDGGNGWAP